MKRVAGHDDPEEKIIGTRNSIGKIKIFHGTVNIARLSPGL